MTPEQARQQLYEAVEDAYLRATGRASTNGVYEAVQALLAEREALLVALGGTDIAGHVRDMHFPTGTWIVPAEPTP